MLEHRNRRVKAGGWAVEIGGERAKCAPLLSDVYDGRENIAAVRRDVNALMADYPLFAW